MKLVESSLAHKIIPPRTKSSEKAPALVLLHGRGANEDDLLGLAEYFDERLFIIAARAPFNFQFGGGYTWYDILEVGRPEPNMFAESYRKLTTFFEDVLKGYPVDHSKIFFLGFSMGTMMSYAVALTRPASVAGVLANSGYIPEETDLKFEWEAIRGKPFFVAHGTSDPVIPVTFGRRSRELLEKAQATVTYHEYEMGHEISEESLKDMMEWLGEML